MAIVTATADPRGHGRLVPRGRNGKPQLSVHIVPHLVIVAGDHPEAVLAGSKVRVDNLTPGAPILPLGVAPFEP